jgi:selenocysteine-specific elongation factor
VLRADVALLDDAAPLGPRTRVRFHLGTQDVGARVVAAGGALTPGAIRGARVLLDEPVLARAGDRFVLRAPSPAATIGGGVIADPSPAVARPRPWVPGLGVSERLETLLAEGGGEGVASKSLPVRLGVGPRDVARLVAAHPSTVALPDGRLVARAVVDATADRATTLIAEHHRRFPLDPGLALAPLRTALGVGDAVAELVLRKLTSAGTVAVEAAAARLAGWAPSLGAGDGALAASIEDRLRAAGREPPSVAELGAALGGDVRAVLRFLERGGVVTPIEDDRYYLTTELDRLVDSVVGAMLPGRVYAPAELRDLTGLSRKYLIPFLEYCDRRGITTRVEGGRIRSGT